MKLVLMIRFCVAVILELHVTMHEEEMRVDTSENQIVSTIKSLLNGKAPEERKKILELVELNDEVRLISAMKSSSIALYFHCITLQGLLHLHHLMSSGRLKTIVEAAFNEILTSCVTTTFSTVDEDTFEPFYDNGVFTIQWPSNHFNQCKAFLQGRTEVK